MPRRALLVVLAVLPLLSASAADARRTTPPPQLQRLSCVPINTPRCAIGPAVPRGLQVILRGKRLYSGMRVTFRWAKGAIATTLRRTKLGWVARVPASARVGTVWVYVRDRRFRRSKARRLKVLEARSTPPGASTPAPGGAVPAAFQGGGMWIWELARSEGGSAAAIGARARANGISTVFVKSADGTNPWSQFSPALVSALHAEGLKVCGWQYLYGSSPVAEARAAATAAANGADCFVMDPETEYQGRYGAAQRYLNELRALVGEGFPIALTSFPYVDYHPNLPYSVFLGPGGAQVNAPQVYFKTIGGGVRTVSEHTYVSNRIYGAPIAPLGQSYDAPSTDDITRFRQLWAAWGAPGISWWSWQSTAAATWPALGGPLAGEAAEDPGWPALARKAKGDQVIWLQQHLASEDAEVAVDGVFGAGTETALQDFQIARGLAASGITDAATWAALLALPVRAVDWTIAGPASARSAGRAAPHSELPPSGRGRP
jgi:hypothetical protein